MAHAQKPDFVFRRNGRVHLNRRRCQFSRLLAGEVCASAVVMLDRPCPIQCMTAGYPLHSPFPPSLLLPCVSVCHHIPFLLYYTEMTGQLPALGSLPPSPLHRRPGRLHAVEKIKKSASFVRNRGPYYARPAHNPVPITTWTSWRPSFNAPLVIAIK